MLASTDVTSSLPAPGSTDPLTDEEERFLRAFARAALVVPRLTDADLTQGEGISGSEYSVLMHLSEAPERRLRMSDIAAAQSLSASGITRIVQRLENRGWVRRRRSPEDGRGADAELTDDGLMRLRSAWPTHLASVRQRLFDHLQGVDLDAVARALEDVVDAAV